MRHDVGHAYVRAPIPNVADEVGLAFLGCANQRIAAKAVEELLGRFQSHGVRKPLADLVNNGFWGRARNHRRKPAWKVDVGDALLLHCRDIGRCIEPILDPDSQ